MEDIKVGDYVRTDNGIIGKYIIQQNINYIDTGKQFIGIDIEKDIVKNSPNIIDLIEKNDIGIMSFNGVIIGKFITEDDIIDLKIGTYKLLQIATKEQFNSIKYEV